jgi:hypothetical protein
MNQALPILIAVGIYIIVVLGLAAWEGWLR